MQRQCNGSVQRNSSATVVKSPAVGGNIDERRPMMVHIGDRFAASNFTVAGKQSLEERPAAAPSPCPQYLQSYGATATVLPDGQPELPSRKGYKHVHSFFQVKHVVKFTSSGYVIIIIIIIIYLFK